ncbi:ArnT family glycosyltransferase [Streptomyces javensis]|uniref:Glycosyltransferase family 39 protein n=1 Tax=Streptomyces javensis TaxID=114698 RepID=A0ABN1X8C4_9ACTN
MTRTRWAAPAALAAILLLAAALYGWALGSLGWGNSYYAAAVKSMGRGWTNVVFGAYDPAGVLTVDKPPAALWPQVISTKVFGLHGWAVLLPQALEGVAAVLLLHRTVRRWAGEAAGLLAALVMTLTPITVAINRDNNPDTLLVLTLVAAAYALTRALQTPSGRSAVWWLCGSGFLVGAGFLTKMLAAWMVAPALAAAWLAGAAGTWLVRVRRLLIAGAVLAVSSLWWVAMVALWPGDRPYIGGSEDGSAWDLVIGYNGLGRIFGENGVTGGPGGASFGGAAGLGRLFNDQVGGQISWLLPLCAVALGVATAIAVPHRRGGGTATATGRPLATSGWVLWGTWLVVCGLVFATQEGIFHPYYTTQLAPAVAALTAGLATALARAHRAGARWALPTGSGAVLVTVVWAVVIIERQPSWNGWLTWAVALAGLGAVALLLLAGRRHRLLPAALGGAVLAVLLAPGAWAFSVPRSTSAMGGANPTAGPAPAGGMPFGSGALPGGGPGGARLPKGFGGGPGGMPPGSGGGGAGGLARGMGGTDLTADQRKILRYAVEHSGSARISLAAEGGAMAASSYILNSDATVIGMGGFIGTDDAPSVHQLETWTGKGELRYVLGSEPGSGGAGPGAMMGGADSPATRRSAWIGDHCAKVPASAYGGRAETGGASGPTGMMGIGTTLYDCAPTK